MHNILCGVSSRSLELRGGWGLTVMATVLLSFGVGATTAAFALMNDAAPHSVTSFSCETMLGISGDPSVISSAGIPSSAELHEQVSEAYQTSHDAVDNAADDMVGSWSDVPDTLGARPLVLLFAAGALALLVACARGAASLLAAPPGFLAHTASVLGALLVAALLIDVFGLPALGIRAIAFAISASLVAVKFARIARKHLGPAAA
jgi:hypothetical protein